MRRTALAGWNLVVRQKEGLCVEIREKGDYYLIYLRMIKKKKKKKTFS